MTTERLPDQWATRDEPVLFAVARRLEQGAIPDGPGIAADVTIDVDVVERSLAALANADYLLVLRRPMRGSTQEHVVTDLTERGRRKVGLWPSGEDSADALVDALRQAERLTTDPAEKGRIRQAMGSVASVSREVMIDVVGSVIAKQSGMG